MIRVGGRKIGPESKTSARSFLRALAICSQAWALLVCSAQAQPGEPPANSNVPVPVNATQTADPVQETEDFQFSGFVQSSYSWNLNQPDNRKNVLQGYNENDSRLRLDVLDLNFQYRLDQPEHTGFRLELTGGSSMPRIDAAAGLFRDAYSGATSTSFDIRQMFVSHTFDNGLRLDVGKFSTHIGYEVMDGVDGRNPNATRALAFTYSPFTHTGLKASYPIDDHWSVTGLVTLGADNWQDTNRSLSWGAQVNYHPTENFSVLANYFQGAEQVGNDSNQRQLVELIGNWKIHEQVTLGAHAMTSREEGLAPGGGIANWNSLGLYSINQLSEQFSLNLRQEWFNDPLGARLGLAGRVSGFTITPEYRMTPDWIVRMDFRFERCDQDIYRSGSNPVGYQNVIWLGQSLKF